MARQWIRKCSLIVGDSGGNGLELSEFRIRFEVCKYPMQTPGFARIRIYNLSDDTANRIQKEFTKIVLKAGYEDESNFGVIFTGNVKQWRKGRENPVDTYLDVMAADGDQAYNYAVVNKTLAAGHTHKDTLQAIAEAFKKYGVTLGHVADLGQTVFPRSRPMFGMARDYLRVLARSTGTFWTIQDEKIQIVKTNEALPGKAFVLNSDTGLIGMPEQTMGGIIARCLLNPNIRINGQVKIDQKSVQQALRGPTIEDGAKAPQLPGIAADGMYKVMYETFIGDTRGPPWYCDLVLQSMNPADNPIPAPLTNGLTNEP